ncbi:MAG TPA: sensor histidine kinase [Phnomibacter sp.]|nr:sensor histidine kinase [Phnomibacter sp.]
MMKKTTLLLVLFFGNGYSLWAQTTPAIDSVLKLLPAQKDSALCMSYNELTWLYRMVDRPTAIAYGEKAVTLAKQIHFPKGEAQAYNDMGIIYMDMQNMSKAKNLFNQSMAIRTQLKDDKGLAALHIKMGIVYNKEGHFDSALHAALQALDLYEKLQDEFGIATALNNAGSANNHVGNIDGALQYHHKALAIREKIHDVAGMGASYVNVGNCYVLLNRFTEAIPFLEKAESYTRAGNNYESLASALNNLGICYLYQHQYSKALPYSEEALDIRRQLNDIRSQVISANVLGRIFNGLKRHADAEKLLLETMAITDTMQSSLQEKIALYDVLAQTYEGSGKFDKALQAERMRIKYIDSMKVTDMNARFSEMETRYQTLQKEQQIAAQQFAIDKRNYILVGIIVLLLLGALLAYNYYNRFKLKKEQQLQAAVMKQQELATKAVMQAEENERRRIASELHDGVGQMMSAARMNLSAFETELPTLSENTKAKFETIINLVDDSCKEVRTVSHNMMPNALLKKGLAAAVREFIDKIDSKMLKVHLYAEGLNERIDANTETMVYRVVQECVNNVIKHSGANKLDISLLNDADGLSITIEDNGKGFNATDIQKMEGIGVKNIQSRIAFLKGTVEWNSRPGNGTLVAIQVPPALV